MSGGQFDRGLLEELIKAIAAEVIGHLGTATTIAKLRRRAAQIGLPPSAADYLMRRWVAKIRERFEHDSGVPPSGGAGPNSGPPSIRIEPCPPCLDEAHEKCFGGSCNCICHR